MPGISLEEFEALQLRRGTRCGVAVALEELGEDAVKLAAALAAPHITGSAIARWLEKQGLSVTQGTVQYHRRGDCSCERP